MMDMAVGLYLSSGKQISNVDFQQPPPPSPHLSNHFYNHLMLEELVGLLCNDRGEPVVSYK